MPYANSNGTRIYFEAVGSGPPLILQHGTAGSCADWHDVGYTEGLRHNYHLILIDARGHGASDKPTAAADYDLQLRVGDVTAVLDQLDLRTAHFLGYSMGGWIGFGVAKYAPDRLRSLILGGAHPYADSMQMFQRLVGSGREGFLAGMEKFCGPFMTDKLRARFADADLRALAAASQDRSDMADLLPSISIPCLLFGGSNDPRHDKIRLAANAIRGARFETIPDCGHMAAVCRRELVLPHVRAFLRS